ncbi:hypothetical protein EU520_00885 [Candidatus Thorarchaeota archaeon]|jgi:hypothetical protein|nr:MAG: hypothetical protein EU520_00885 [Candidatus Thorarchaeota archaeon]
MGWKEILQIALFVLAWTPVAVLGWYTVIGAEPTYTHDFSIYNTEYNGLSQFRSSIEDSREALSIQASMSVVTRYNGSAVVVIMGPVRDFSLDVTLVIYSHLLAGGGVLIADDFGTANSSFAVLNLLMSGLLGGQMPVNVSGMLSYIDGVLFDLESYDPAKEPRLPIIRDFHSLTGIGGALTAGVSELHLNHASAINPYCLLGLNGFAWTSPRTWCETDIDNSTPAPDPWEWNGSLPVAGALDLSTVENPLGGRLVATSDPSIFINDMWGRFSGNRQFGANIVEWLSHGDTDVPVLFCEELLAVPPASGEFFFGLYLSRALWLSSLPYLSAIYPVFTAVGIRKYLPELKKPEVKSVSDVFLRRGQTYFGERMTYYRTEGNYTRVVKMLYRKLRRGLRKKQQWTEYDPRKVWDLMRYKDSKLTESEFYRTITRIEDISSDPSIKIKESEMMELFFFMRNIQRQLVD